MTLINDGKSIINRLYGIVNWLYGIVNGLYGIIVCCPVGVQPCLVGRFWGQFGGYWTIA